MFYRTSEFDAGFGVQPGEATAPGQSGTADRAAPSWLAAVRAAVHSGARAIGRRQAHRPVRLSLDAMSNHMLRDIGLNRVDLGALGGDPFRPSSRTGRRR